MQNYIRTGKCIFYGYLDVLGHSKGRYKSIITQSFRVDKSSKFHYVLKVCANYTEKHFIWQKTWVVAESLYIRTAKNILTTETLCSQKV